MNISVRKEKCMPSTCNQECVSVCPQNKKGKVAIKIKNKKAEILRNNCINCLQCLYACPLDAIVTKTSKGKKLTSKDLHLNYKQKGKKGKEEKELFEINKEIYKRYDEKYTIFNRRLWDQSYEGYKKPIFMNARAKIEQGLDGYSEIELAAVDASWSIENIVSMREYYRERIKTLDEVEKKKLEKQMETENVKKVNFDVQKPLKYKIKDPKEMSIWLKKVSKFFGADLIGIAKLDPKWIYAKDRMDREYVLPKNLKYAVVIVVEMDIDAINTTPKMPAEIATGLGYSKMAFVRTLVASFIKNLGYEAISAGNTLGLSVPC
ncbi:MAG: 4Fe-4S dicluster domain-containing protein [Candidatus Heimdallarchaeaceae archaeon]